MPSSNATLVSRPVEVSIVKRPKALPDPTLDQ